MTYNIRKGKGASGRLDGSVSRMAAALQSHSPDLVFCQEVFDGGKKAVQQSAQLADALDLSSYYEPNRTSKRGHYGNATLSRYRPEMVQNFNISTNRLERRGVLYTKLHIGSRPVHVFNAHLGLNQRQRTTQIKHIGALIGTLAPSHQAVVLAGDFNDWNHRIDNLATSHLGLANAFGAVAGRDKLTWHARRPVFNLDRVYTRHLQVVGCGRLSEAPWTTLSDHFPLWVDLKVL